VKPVSINLCPTGMVPTRSMSPHVPLTPEEIAADVLRCAEIGVTSVHLHARGPDGRPTHRKEVYGRIIGLIREQRDDLVLGVSCSGRDVSELEARAEVLTLDGDLKPDMASLTTSSLNFSSQASMNAPDVVRGLAERMRDAGIVAELEIFDLGMASYVGYLAERDVLVPPFHANVFFGNVASAQLRPSEIGAVLAALPARTSIAFAGIGRVQRRAVAMGIALGHGVRIGLEDNLYEDDARSTLATNPGLIAWVHELAALLERTVESPVELRARLRGSVSGNAG
jgi:3-keto-5-aminohexanoate cleavage enzyme